MQRIIIAALVVLSPAAARAVGLDDARQAEIATSSALLGAAATLKADARAMADAASDDSDNYNLSNLATDAGILANQLTDAVDIPLKKGTQVSTVATHLSRLNAQFNALNLDVEDLNYVYTQINEDLDAVFQLENALASQLASDDGRGRPDRPGSGSGSDTGTDTSVTTSGGGTGGDIGVDTGIDTGIDTGMDTGGDTGVDTGVDTGIDTGVDSGIDVGSDSGSDESGAGSSELTATGAAAATRATGLSWWSLLGF